MLNNTILRSVSILLLRAALVFVLIGAGWLIYKRFPAGASDTASPSGIAHVQIVLKQTEEPVTSPLDITVDLFPVDIVAVQHEYFTEPRAGKTYYDFLKDRMKGRSPVTTHLDKEGRGNILLTPGSWWLHAKLSGDEELEWRLPVNVIGPQQTIELNIQNAYTRSKTF